MMYRITSALFSEGRTEWLKGGKGEISTSLLLGESLETETWGEKTKAKKHGIFSRKWNRSCFLLGCSRFVNDKESCRLPQVTHLRSKANQVLSIQLFKMHFRFLSEHLSLSPGPQVFCGLRYSKSLLFYMELTFRKEHFYNMFLSAVKY